MSTLVLAAAEHSKTPFYIVGSCLAAWAFVSAILSITRADFPGSGTTQRLYISVSVSLVVAAMATAVITS
jgi:hypothetical protein